MKTHPLKIWRLCQLPPLSQRKLAKKLGVTDAPITRAERWGWPSHAFLKRVHRLTGLTPNDFFKPLAIPARAKLEE